MANRAYIPILSIMFAVYKFQIDNADLIPTWTDMQPVLEHLPIQMTSVAE